MSADNNYDCPKCGTKATGDEDDERYDVRSYEAVYIENGEFVADIDMSCDKCDFTFAHTFRRKIL